MERPNPQRLSHPRCHRFAIGDPLSFQAITAFRNRRSDALAVEGAECPLQTHHTRSIPFHPSPPPQRPVPGCKSPPRGKAAADRRHTAPDHLAAIPRGGYRRPRLNPCGLKTGGGIRCFRHVRHLSKIFSNQPEPTGAALLLDLSVLPRGQRESSLFFALGENRKRCIPGGKLGGDAAICLMLSDV